MEHKQTPQFSSSSQSTEKEAELFKKKADELFNKGLDHLQEKNDQDSLNKAAHCFHKASTLGHLLAVEYLAYCCFDDYIITATYMPWFEEMAKAHDQEDIQKRAIFFLGYCYYYGKCARTQSYKTAAKLFYKIWTMGMVAAQYYLALCCLLGRITKVGKKDLVEDFSTTYSPEIHGTSERQKSIFLAEKFANLAAERGYVDAQYLLGMIWLENDFSKAYFHCDQAAQQGHIDAQEFLNHFFYEYSNGFTLHSYPAHLPLAEYEIFRNLKVKAQINNFFTKLEFERDQDNTLNHASLARKKSETMFPKGSAIQNNSSPTPSFPKLYSAQPVSEAKVNTVTLANKKESNKSKFTFEEFAQSFSQNAEKNPSLSESKPLTNSKIAQNQIPAPNSQTQSKPASSQTQPSVLTTKPSKTESKINKQVQFAQDPTKLIHGKVTILKRPDKKPEDDQPKPTTPQLTETSIQTTVISKTELNPDKDKTAPKPETKVEVVTSPKSNLNTNIPASKNHQTINQKVNNKDGQQQKTKSENSSKPNKAKKTTPKQQQLQSKNPVVETKTNPSEVKHTITPKTKQKIKGAETTIFNPFGILEEDSTAAHEPSHIYFDKESMNEGKILFEQGFVLFNEKKYEQALNCFLKSESNNYPPANLFLGLMYSSDFYGVPKNTKRSNNYYAAAKRLLDQAHAIPEFSGINYDFARYFFTAQQDQQALDYLDTSAQLGDAEAQYHLSLLCLKYPFINEEFGPAFEWLEKSAEQGCTEAQSSLGQHYLQQKQFDLALLWLQKAAKGNDANAQFCMAIYYLTNNSLQKAEELLLKAANQGYANAQYYLGMGYLKLQKFEQSHHWLNKAAENNHVEAIKYLSSSDNYFKTTNNHDAFTPLATEESENNPIHSEPYILEKKTEPSDDSVSKESKKTEAELRQQAEDDYALACNFYFGRNGKPQSYKKAANKFCEAAIAGHKDAQYYYGLCFSKGHGVSKDNEKAIEWLQKAVAQGHQEAKAELDSLIQPKSAIPVKISSEPLPTSNKNSNSSSTMADKLKSSHLETKLSKCVYLDSDDASFKVEFNELETQKIVNADADSIYNLGLQFFYGRGIAKQQDYKKAVALFKICIGMGSDSSLYNLGQCYNLGGFGITQDLKIAAEYLQKACQFMIEAEKSGSTDVILPLGCSYWNGEGVEKDFATAVSYFHRAETLGHVIPDTYYRLGVYYSEIDYDFEKAKHYYDLAIAAGHSEAASALKQLSDPKDISVSQIKGNRFRYSETEGDIFTVEFNELETNKIRNAFTSGDCYALFELGMQYYRGNGVAKTKDYQKAVALFRTAVEQDYEPALFHLAQCFLEGGFGINVNEEEAEDIFEQAVAFMENAVAHGKNDIFLELGYCYWHGYGVEKNLAEAVNYFLKAENLGQATAQAYMLLGIYYQSFQNYDFAKATYWFRRAKNAGNKFAQNRLDEMVKQDSNSQSSVSKKTGDEKLDSQNKLAPKKESTSAVIKASAPVSSSNSVSSFVETKTESKKPESGDSCIEEGWGLLDLHQYKNAEEQFKKAIQTYNYPAAFIFMGFVAKNRGKSPDFWFQQAKEKYSQWFLEKTDNPQRNLYRGMYLSFVMNEHKQEGYNSVKFAADKGVVMAQRFLAVYYFDKNLEFYNMEKAEATLVSAIKNGDRLARETLIRVYSHPANLEDYSEHLTRHLGKGAENNEPSCLHQFALGYYNSRETDPNLAQLHQDQAGKLFEAAAEQGFIPSKYYLGLCYFHGKGGKPKNINMAHKMINETALQHHKESQDFLEKFKAFFDIICTPGAPKQFSKTKQPIDASSVSQSASTQSSSAFFGQKPSTQKPGATKDNKNGSSKKSSPATKKK